MKRSAFTMIELIFVIVILGILAAVAIPKLAGVQDDALVSSEKTGVGSIRAGTTAIRGRGLTRGVDFNQTVSGPDATGNVVDAYVTYSPQTTGSGSIMSAQRWPLELSTTSTSVTAGSQITLAADAGGTTAGIALISVLEPEGRTSWETKAKADGNVTIVGPASSTIAPSANAELDTDGSWLYSGENGSISWRATTKKGS